MAQSNTENQRAFKERMYEAGYKQKIVWVPREAEGKKARLERKAFMLRLEALTAGWTKTKMNKFFGEVLNIIKLKIEEENKGKL